MTCSSSNIYFNIFVVDSSLYITVLHNSKSFILHMEYHRKTHLFCQKNDYKLNQIEYAQHIVIYPLLMTYNNMSLTVSETFTYLTKKWKSIYLLNSSLQ